MIAWLTAAAFAVPAGGFRIDGALATRHVALRPAFVATDQAPEVFELAIATRLTSGRWVLRASIPYVETWGAGLHDSGLGQLRLGAGVMFGEAHRPATLGLEVALPSVGESNRVYAWGTVARDAVPAGEALVVYEASWHPEAPWALRVAAGTLTGEAWARGFIGIVPVLDVGVSHVTPIDDQFGVVTEVELTVDRTPATVRGLFRVGDERGVLDMGVQLPLWAYAQGIPTLQLIGQARASF